MIHFNPIICARENGVPIEDSPLVDYAVANPIHNPDYSGLVFTAPTINVGINGLIITEVDSSGLYIPQRLDQDLAKDLTVGNFGRYSHYDERMEAANLILGWGLEDELTYDDFTLIEQASVKSDDYLIQARNLFIIDGLIEVVDERIEQEDDQYEREN